MLLSIIKYVNSIVICTVEFIKKDIFVAIAALLLDDGLLLSNYSVINQMVPSKYNYDLMSNIFAVIAVIARVWSNCTASQLHPLRKFQIAGFPSQKNLDFQIDASNG